jgi:FtsP/CotA-like multicopper oxidase with cupredoxin domain
MPTVHWLTGRSRITLIACLVPLSLVTAVSATWGGGSEAALPIARPNDQRVPAGRLVNGELHLDLEVVEAEWYPRGEGGPRVITIAFAEAGRAPSIPGPLLRAPAGTAIRATVRNTLDRPVLVRGLVDRATMPPVPPPQGRGIFPAFAFGDSLVIGSGATGEARFTPTSEVSSFYYGRVLPAPGVAGPPLVPAGDPGQGAFLGALIIDPPATAAPPDERVFVITQWASSEEPGTVSFKMMLNGLSWPFTEQLQYGVGDSVRWRVINVSVTQHPMHLHGFYFHVDALGDAQSDTTYTGDARPLAVTQLMAPFSAMRITWVPERAGNWLFHCHLIRHMHDVQEFREERARRATGAADAHHLDGMAGLVLGITIHPRDGIVREPAPSRRIDLWTGQRPDVYDGKPELGFVVQEGSAPPARDSTVVPGSPIVLTLGEPTEIIVHNRLDMPLSVHWHGLELRSLYDGVGHWSGSPGTTRAPIPPGDSARVLITPPRAGTFMYHTHGEAGPGLSQGLYGPFLVLERATARDPDADRVFVLAARGARRDAAPAINGRVRPLPERFTRGQSYRLRFLHISPDESKRVRLLKDGNPVQWRPLARDGADLSEAMRRPRSAAFALGVGETVDVEWTPDAEGVYVLEVRTSFYPATGGTVVQRVAFGVGDVAESDLVLPQGAGVPPISLTSAERARYVGTYAGEFAPSVAGPVIWQLRVWELDDKLRFRLAPRDQQDALALNLLIPVAEHTFRMGLDLDGLMMEPTSQPDLRFLDVADSADRVELRFGNVLLATLSRQRN